VNSKTVLHVYIMSSFVVIVTKITTEEKFCRKKVS